MRVGDEVIHRNRQEFGVGKITSISSNGTCTVEFEGNKFFSGISIDVFATRQEIEKEARNKKEEDLKKRPSRAEITMCFSKFGVNSLWYISHKNNVPSILSYGILNRQEALYNNVIREDISNHDVQLLRNRRDPHYERSIHEYAPLYVRARNPMLYACRDQQDELCLIEVSLAALLVLTPDQRRSYLPQEQGL